MPKPLTLLDKIGYFALGAFALFLVVDLCSGSWAQDYDPKNETLILDFEPASPGTKCIIFYDPKKLRVCEDGKIFYQDREIATDAEVYTALRSLIYLKTEQEKK